jgi:Flp pilus assembly protein TadD
MKADDANSSKPNILDTIKLSKALSLAKRKSKDGRLEEARNIYEDILQKFSKNKEALSELQLLAGGATEEPKDPPSEQLQSIINLFTQGQLQQALSKSSQMLERFPNSVVLYNIAGASNAGLMQFDAAINSYKKALKIKPDFADAYNNMGNALNEKGDLEAAIDSYKQALKIKPDYADAYYNMGIALKDKGDLEAAIDNYKQALKIKPDYAEAYNNMGTSLNEKGDLEAAIDNYKQALKIKPDYAEAYNNMGTSLNEKGDLEAAIESYKQALKIKPDYAEAYNNMGTSLNEKGDLEVAIESYKQALKIKPDYVEAYINLGMTFIEVGNRDNAFLNLKKSHELIRGKDPVNPFHQSFLTISKAKIDHDIDQFKYLADSGYDVEKFQALAELYRDVSLEIDWSGGQIQRLSNEHQKLLKETYNRTINVLEAPELVDGTLRDTLERGKITKDYFKHDHGLTYIDNFLTPSALNSIRKFLLGSTIWYEIKRGGYLGAYLKEGLACPLLLQIADDLRINFPEIFKNHQLKQLWAYKYDSRAYKDDNGLTGIKAHADQAAVNVNFWITPATANLNPESGGLIVHNTPAPLGWDFKTYNNDDEKIAKCLENGSREKSIVPYNENRVVIFNSNLIHKTDRFEFKEGYENRRINVTMLFGLRED